MLKIILPLLMAVSASAGTYSTNLLLYKPATGDTNYVTPFAASMDTLDAAIADKRINKTAVFASSLTVVGPFTVQSSATVTGSATIVGGVTISSTIIQSPWIAPSFASSWINFDGGYGQAAYMRDSMGFVHLKGMVKNGTGNDIFTLPAGYRPALREIFVVNSNSAFGRLDVVETGVVTAIVYNNTFVTLNGITFRAAGY